MAQEHRLEFYQWKRLSIIFYCSRHCDRRRMRSDMIPFKHRDCNGCLLLAIYELNGGYDA